MSEDSHFSLATRLTLRLSLVLGAAVLLSIGIFLLESFDEYRRDFGGRMTDAAGLIGRSIVNSDGKWHLDLAMRGDLREIPDLRVAARRVADGSILPGSDPVLVSALMTAPEIARESIQTAPFRDFVSTPIGPVEIVMTRAGLQLQDILQWLEEISTEVMPTLVLLIGGSLLVVVTTIRHDLRPVWRVAREAERVSPSDSTTRLSEVDVPVEILPLVHAVKGALTRLDAALSSQRQFTADAAHELRTPLAVLRARIEALSDNEAVLALKTDIERFARLVDQLLAISVLDGHDLQLDQDIDISAVARDVVADLAPLATSRERSLAFQGPSRPVHIRGNAVALEEGVRNLVENALRHTPAGEGVEVAVCDNGAIEVRDCGPGIPVSHREAIFQRFWRETPASNGGAGLGLPIVKRIAEAHGGSVTIDDRKGGGSVFRIELPIRSAGDPQRRPAS